MQAPTPHSRQVPHRSVLKPSHWHRLRDVQPQPCASSPAPAKAAPALPHLALQLFFHLHVRSVRREVQVGTRNWPDALVQSHPEQPGSDFALGGRRVQVAAALRQLAVTACKPPVGLDVQAPLPTATHSLPECRQLPASTCWITELKQAGLACTCWQSP